MIIKDKFGTKINLQQSKSGKIIIPIGTKTITLSKEDADSFTLYDIEDFDLDLYQKAYNNSFNLTPSVHVNQMFG
jgi:hypothetical protein